jgi:hypothetical protein
MSATTSTVEGSPKGLSSAKRSPLKDNTIKETIKKVIILFISYLPFLFNKRWLFSLFHRPLSFPLPIHHLHHLQKLLLGEYPFLHKQPGKGSLLDNLGYEEIFKGNDLLRVKGWP